MTWAAHSLGTGRKGRAQPVTFITVAVCLLITVLWVHPQGLGSGGQQEASSRDELLRAAEEALRREDYQVAVKALRQVVVDQPDYAAAWFNLAYALSGLKEDVEAAKAYQRTLQLQPDLFEARLNLGILLVAMKQPQSSLPHLARATELKPEHARAHFYYGRALHLTGELAAAEKQLRESLRVDPGLSLAHHELGQVLLTGRRYADALNAFQAALEADAQLVEARLGLALAAEGLKDMPQAVSHLETYLTARPDDAETRFHLARLYLEQGKNESALNALEAAYQTKSDLPGLAAALGDVHALLKQFAESEKFYREAVGAAPSDADLRRSLGETLLHQQKLIEAESEFRTSLTIEPSNSAAMRGLATVLYLQKRYREAIPLLETLARSSEPSAATVFALATCYDHLRDLGRALAAYERFLQMSRGRSPDQEWQARQRAKVIYRELRR